MDATSNFWSLGLGTNPLYICYARVKRAWYMSAYTSSWKNHARIIVPGDTITLADLFRGNEYDSGFVRAERIRGGTNPLSHRNYLYAVLVPNVRPL